MTVEPRYNDMPREHSNGIVISRETESKILELRELLRDKEYIKRIKWIRRLKAQYHFNISS